MKWLDKFKIAVIEEDTKAVDFLLSEIPEFKKIDEMREAYTLIGEAKKKFENEQASIVQKMNKMQNAKKFLEGSNQQSKFEKVY